MSRNKLELIRRHDAILTDAILIFLISEINVMKFSRLKIKLKEV